MRLVLTVPDWRPPSEMLRRLLAARARAPWRYRRDEAGKRLKELLAADGDGPGVLGALKMTVKAYVTAPAAVMVGLPAPTATFGVRNWGWATVADLFCPYTCCELSVS